MAKRRSRKNEGDVSVAMPGGMKFKVEKGGNIDSLEKKFKNSFSGDFLRIGKDEEYIVAILAKPTDWYRGQEHSLTNEQGGWVYIPCTNNCPACKKHPENAARLYAYVPVYVYEHKQVRFYRAPSTVMTTLISKYGNYKDKGFLTRQWLLSRFDGSGPTQYEFDRQDEKVSDKVKEAKIPDIEKALTSRWLLAIRTLGWNVSGENFDDDDDVFSHEKDDDNNDVDIEDINNMGRKELIDFVEDYEMDIEDPEEFNTVALRKLIVANLKDEDND